MDPKQNNNESVRHSLVLGALLALTFMVPGVQSSFAGTGYANTAAVGTVVSDPCPTGYVCTTSAKSSDDATAKVVGSPKLELKYDSILNKTKGATRGEALLTATFMLTVDGGKNGAYISEYPYIQFLDSKGIEYDARSKTIKPLSPVSKIDKIPAINGDLYVVKPGAKEIFYATATVDPKELPAGTYHANLPVIIAYQYSDAVGVGGHKIIVDSKDTNTKTIVGEVSPYISSITPNEAYVGDKVVINGQRLSGADTVNIDRQPLLNSLVSADINGTNMSFNVPALTPGWHIVTVSSTNGMSNEVWLNVLSTNTVQSISITYPQAGYILDNSGTKDSGLIARIQWTSVGIDSHTIGINLIDPNGAIFKTIATGISNTGTYDWKYDSSIPNGSYKIELYDEQSKGGSLIGYSGVFSLVNNLVTCPPGYICTGLSPVTFSNSAVSQSILTVSQTGLAAQDFTFKYSLTAGNDPIFIAKDYNLATMATTTLNLQASQVNVSMFGDDNVSGDGASYFYIAPGQTKIFTISGRVTGMTGTVVGLYDIVGLNYGLNSNNLASNTLQVPQKGGGLLSILFSF